MKTHAYNSLYLEDAMNNLGTMLDCAVHKWRLEIPVIFRACRGWN